eukprot:comp10617_c0_seq1/m.5302 comp10617_c0_seq1/g.5302  ORF comp10617_c0_seq1/g.5302 comp10617_c0_seq1/m.5302 type:complete len:131 (-) comp10617_c0_seq1:92-484(-)
MSLPNDTNSFFSRLLPRIPGLLAVVLSDRDGVIVEQARTDGLPDGLPSPAFLATLAVASEQAGKLGLKRSKGIAAMFNDVQIVHFWVSPFVISLYAKADASTAVLMDLEGELQQAVRPLVPVLSNSLQNV